jgi:hypothetical protein
MEYQGVEFAVVQTIPRGWRWSVTLDSNDKVGEALTREAGVMRAKLFIDGLLRTARKRKDGTNIADVPSKQPHSEIHMAHDQGIDLDQKGEQQPKDKDRAQTANTTDKGKMPPQPVRRQDREQQ